MKEGKFYNDDERYPLSLKEGLINVNDETMEYSGQTYYKWVKYKEQEDGTSIPDSNEDYPDSCCVVLTDTLTPNLPFTEDSPECKFILSINTERDDNYNPKINHEDNYIKEALIDNNGNIKYEE